MFRIIGLIEIFISNKVRQLAVSRLLKNLLGTTLGKEVSGKEINDDECILTQLFLAQTIVKLLYCFHLPLPPKKQNHQYSKSRYLLFITGYRMCLV